ncbi:hypothetical protein DCN13_19660 [Rhodococcus ruber]|nr:hypothetical protein DCN13_19660 [Rhodococcus ruber]
MYPSSPTDTQWRCESRPCSPSGNTDGEVERPEKPCRRMALDTVLHVVRGEIAWRQPPVDFPAGDAGVRDLRLLRAGRGAVADTRRPARGGSGPPTAVSRPGPARRAPSDRRIPGLGAGSPLRNPWAVRLRRRRPSPNR